jgi:hypothetical protein
MTELKALSSIRQFDFAGSSLSIDVIKPPRIISIPPHNIVDENGNDTGIKCPVTKGKVFITELLGGETSHRVTITCESANQAYEKPIAGKYLQCSNRSVTEIKFP